MLRSISKTRGTVWRRTGKKNDQSVRSERRKTMQQEPLTINELKNMAGQSVWCPEENAYGIVMCDKSGPYAGIPFLHGVYYRNGKGIGTVFNLNIIRRKLKCYRVVDEVQNKEHKVIICDFAKHGGTINPYQENNQEENIMLTNKEKWNDKEYYWKHFDDIMYDKITSGIDLDYDDLMNFVGMDDHKEEETYLETDDFDQKVRTIIRLHDKYFEVIWVEGTFKEAEYPMQPREVIPKEKIIYEWVPVKEK